MCDLQKLAFTEHGYVVRCVECGHYQMGFGTTMLTLNNDDFNSLFNTVTLRLNTLSEKDSYFSEETKSVLVTTPLPSCCFVLTRNELQALFEIMDKADNEARALSLFELFEK